MMDEQNIIIKPLLTEKSTLAKEESNKYYFEVHKKANKVMLKKLFNKLFKVDIVKCNISNIRGKKVRTRHGTTYKSNAKKALVTLKKGQGFDFYEGI